MHPECHADFKKDFVNVPTELINMKEVVQRVQYRMHCAEEDWQIPFGSWQTAHRTKPQSTKP